MAVMARAMPRRRQSGSVLTKITLAAAPKAAEPDVPRTVPPWSTATQKANARGSERRWSARACESEFSGAARHAAATASVSGTPPGGSSGSRWTGLSVSPVVSAGACTVCRSRQIIAVALPRRHAGLVSSIPAHRTAASQTVIIPARASPTSVDRRSRARSSVTSNRVRPSCRRGNKPQIPGSSRISSPGGRTAAQRARNASTYPPSAPQSIRPG